MSASHTLAHGNPVASKYGTLGFSGVTMVPPPDRLLGMITGLSGSGKTYLFLSNPEAFILNTDLSSTSLNAPPATVWPGINSETGSPIDPVEGNIRLTWEALLQKEKILLELSDNEQPRPSCVVLDSLSTSIPLVRDWVVENCVRLGLRNDPVLHWRQLDGRAAWDEVYSELVRIALTLRRSGYGFYYILHLTKKHLPYGEEGRQYKDVLAVNITDNFYSRIYPLCELIGAVASVPRTETTVVARELGGKKLPPKKVTRIVEDRMLFVDNSCAADKLDADTRGIIKPRVSIPEPIILPPEHAWEAFSHAYYSATNTSQGETPSE